MAYITRVKSIINLLLNFIQLITPLTTINKGILVNDNNFTIEINTVNHFLNNRAQTLNDYYLEVERVIFFLCIFFFFL